MMIIKVLLFWSILLDDKLLRLLIFWLFHFIDWLRALSCKGSCSMIKRNIHFVIKYLIAYSILGNFEKSFCTILFFSVLDLSHFEEEYAFKAFFSKLLEKKRRWYTCTWHCPNIQTWPMTPCLSVLSFRLRDNSVHFHECSHLWVGISKVWNCVLL